VSTSASAPKRWLMIVLAGLVVMPALLYPVRASAADAERKVKTRVSPVYPELARKMAVSGSVKVQVTVAPNGAVKNVKVIGGHPLLVDAAVDAVKKWKYETAPEETTQLVEFKFSAPE
jgi:TonB family protein